MEVLKGRLEGKVGRGQVEGFQLGGKDMIVLNTYFRTSQPTISTYTPVRYSPSRPPESHSLEHG